MLDRPAVFETHRFNCKAGCSEILDYDDPFNLLKTLAPMPVDVFGLPLLQRFIMLALANEEYQAAKSKNAYKMLSAHAHIAFFERDEYLEEDYANTKSSVSRALHRLEVRGLTQKKLGKWELSEFGRGWVEGGLEP